MSLTVKVINNHPELANTYIAIKEDKALIVDPGQRSETISLFLEKLNVSPIGILITHGHFDHIASLSQVQKRYGIPVYMLEKEIKMLEDPHLNGSVEYIGAAVYEADVTPLYEDEELDLKPFRIKVMHTPFHTEGSICYYFYEEDVIFTGDTLFKNSIGRSDLPTGSFRNISSSLKKLQELPKNTVIYPGHGPASTIDQETKFNRYFRTKN